MSLINNIDHLSRIDGVVAIMVDVPQRAFRGPESWQQTLVDCMVLFTNTTEPAMRIAIGEHIRAVQATFSRLYNQPIGDDGFDRLLRDGDTLPLGRLQVTALFVPGHTPADLAYQIEDAVFVGDTLFMPDLGSARCDFPGGDASQLYRSVRRLLALPPETRLFVCHDYPQGREARWETSVAEQRLHNIHVHDGTSEAAFIAMRQARDATLGMPALILPSLQVNIRAGQLPAPDANGVRYLRIPINALPPGQRG